MKASTTFLMLILPVICLGQIDVESTGLEANATGQVCESTGFEAQEATCGWETGFICGSGFVGICEASGTPQVCTGDNSTDGNCCVDNPNPLNDWYISITSRHCNEPHIDTINPASGTQHLRFSRDETGGDPPSCTGFSGECRQTAFTPTTGGPLPITRTIISFDIAMSTNFVEPVWPDYRFQLLLYADHQERPWGPHLLFTSSGVVIIDCNFYAPCGLGLLTGDGSYDHVTIDINPCINELSFTLTNAAGEVTGYFPFLDIEFTALTVERAIFYGDNSEIDWDIDNFSIERVEECVVGSCCDRNPGLGFCYYPFGEAACEGPNKTWFEDEECMGTECNEITGACCNGFTNTCADDVSIRFCQSHDKIWFEGARCSDGMCESAVGGCCDFSPGSGGYCFDGVLREVCKSQPYRRWHILEECSDIPCDEITGACCDWLTAICTDNVLSGACASASQTWRKTKLCRMIDCPPDTGACCDASPGSAGACTDDLLSQDCVGEHQTWKKLRTCDQVQCLEVTGACCDDSIGSCFVSIQSDCLESASLTTWTPGANCDQISCVAVDGACCDTGTNNPTEATCTITTLAACDCVKCNWTRDANCGNVLCDANFQVIPTVSEWGLAILALALLVGAKMLGLRGAGRTVS